MLKAIILQDFFSFRGETIVKLNKEINLLLGINGSGKTSFINALRILSEGVAVEGLRKLIQEQWGGFDQIVNFSGENRASYTQITYIFDCNKLNELNPDVLFPADVHYCITINRSGTSYTLTEQAYTNEKEQITYLDFNNGKGSIAMLSREGKVGIQEYTSSDFSGQELILRQINDPIHYVYTNTLRKAIEDIAIYNNFDVSEGSKVRTTSEFSTDTRLRKTGENLTQILNHLKLNHIFDFERLEETFRNVNPYIKNIEISNLYGQSYLSVREKNMSRTIGAQHLSDGTLRFLLLESIFYNPDKGSFIAIDEPERGMHPDMIRSVAEMMKTASKQSQLIIASHSPHLLNQFDLEDILIFEKNEENSTIVHTISEDDLNSDEECLPGQMWLSGQIGGKRW